MNHPERTFQEMGFEIESMEAFIDMVNGYLDSIKKELEQGIGDTSKLNENQIASINRHFENTRAEFEYLTEQMQNPQGFYEQIRDWYDSLVKAQEQGLSFEEMLNQFINQKQEGLPAITGFLVNKLQTYDDITLAEVLSRSIRWRLLRGEPQATNEAQATV